MFSYCIFHLMMTVVVRRGHLLDYQAFLVPEGIVESGMRFS